MMYKERSYPETKFGGFTDIDGTMAFFNRVNALLAPAFTVLDVGCGRGAFSEDPVPIRRELRILKGKVARVMGIDVDPEARHNPFLDEFRLIRGETWPVESDSIDLIVCDNVLEHIPDPDQWFFETTRVLRNGGYVCIRTPNAWGYVALFARIIPGRYHSRVVAAVQDGRKEGDVFPTVYRCNTLGKLRKQLRTHNFTHVVYGHESEPAYLSFSAIAYRLGVLHQKLAPSCAKPVIFAFGRKIDTKS